jgi:hypothetical protein
MNDQATLGGVESFAAPELRVFDRRKDTTVALYDVSGGTTMRGSRRRGSRRRIRQIRFGDHWSPEMSFLLAIVLLLLIVLLSWAATH